MQRRNIAACIILSIVTCGIYGIYWFIVLTDDTNQISGQTNATSGGMSFLYTILTCAIYYFYWLYKMGETIDMAKRNRGLWSGNTGIVYMLLGFFGLGIVSYALLQNELNTLIDMDQNRIY